MRRSSARVTIVLAGLCVALSGLVWLLPELRGSLGDGAADPIVRLATAPFVHGFGRGSLLPHLAGNLVLLIYAGSRVEGALGSMRFATLTLAALAAYALIQLTFRFEVNGASVFIWAYAPPLALLHAPAGRPRPGSVKAPTIVVLVIMWILVPAFMTAVPYSFGWSGSLLGAFFVANVFHFSATAVGIFSAWIWRSRLRGSELPEERLM